MGLQARLDLAAAEAAAPASAPAAVPGAPPAPAGARAEGGAGARAGEGAESRVVARLREELGALEAERQRLAERVELQDAALADTAAAMVKGPMSGEERAALEVAAARERKRAEYVEQQVRYRNVEVAGLRTELREMAAKASAGDPALSRTVDEALPPPRPRPRRRAPASGFETPRSGACEKRKSASRT